MRTCRRMSCRTSARWIWMWGWRSHWWVKRVIRRWRSGCERQSSLLTRMTRANRRDNAGASATPPVMVDFLIEPEQSTEAQAGRLFDLTKDWAAIIAPGLHLAFKNNKSVTLTGQT